MSLGGAVLAFLALQKIGLTNIAAALITASPTLVLLGLAIMCGSMVLRARLVERDPARGAAAHPRAIFGRRARHVHRRADVLDAAGATR